MNDWHEEEAKAECLDLRIKVRELEAQVAELKADKERLRVLYKITSDALNDIADKVGYLK